jgi:hypothetical protein
VPTTYVSRFLGHGNLTTTTRYLNPTRVGLRLAIEKLEQHGSVAGFEEPSADGAGRSGRGAPPLASVLQSTAPAAAQKRPALDNTPAAKHHIS